jgi:flagellar motor switch protein FliG
MKQNVVDDYNLLSGQQKAAILMLSLDEERSAGLFALMDDEEIKELSVIMASLGKINSNIIEQLIAEFNEKISSTGSLVGTYESTERLLAKALDKDRVSAIMEEIRGPAGRTMWDKLPQKRISADHCRYPF